jgi:hypothetical protein
MGDFAVSVLESPANSGVAMKQCLDSRNTRKAVSIFICTSVSIKINKLLLQQFQKYAGCVQYRLRIIANIIGIIAMVFGIR